MSEQSKAAWFDDYLLGKVPPPVVQYWQVRRVGPELCINFAGRRWSVLGLDGVAVGDLVAVRADSNPTGAPLLSVGSEVQPGIWASPPAPAHSCPRSAPVDGIPASLGNPPTGCVPLRECPLDALGTPAERPAATPKAHTHSHSAGTAGAAPAADSIAKLVALARALAPGHCSPGTGTSLVSVSLHFSCGGVE